MVRYVDDILIFTRNREKAEKLQKIVEEFLKPRGLELSKEKTYIANIKKKGFKFLGRSYRREPYYG